jgi:hypothetical protein
MEVSHDSLYADGLFAALPDINGPKPAFLPGPSKPRFRTVFAPFLSVFVFLAVSGCDLFENSMVDYFLDNTGVVEVMGVTGTENTIQMTNGTILVSPGPAEIRLALFNPRNFTVRQTLTGAPGENITVVQTGSGEIVVKIPEAKLDAEYSFTLAMQSPDGLRDFAPYTMRVRCVSFDTALLDFKVDGVSLDSDGYAFKVNVPYETETVTLAAATVAPNATLEIYEGTDDSGTPLTSGTHTAKTTALSLVLGNNYFYIKVTNTNNGKSQGYAVTVYRRASSDKVITAFAILTPVSAAGVVDEASHTVSVTVPYGTVTGAMTAAVTHTGDSIGPNPGAPRSYAGPVTYTVTAADGTTQDYTVMVTEAPGATITGTIADPGIPVLTFSASSLSVSAGVPVTITLGDGSVTATWYIGITGPVPSSPITYAGAAYTFTLADPGFYSVNVIATVGGIDYSGSFALIVN